MSEEKKEQTRGEQLRKALLYDKKNGYDRLIPGDLEAMETYCTGYKQFLDAGKTERECVDRAVALAEQAGFKPYVRGGRLRRLLLGYGLGLLHLLAGGLFRFLAHSFVSSFGGNSFSNSRVSPSAKPVSRAATAA